MIRDANPDLTSGGEVAAPGEETPASAGTSDGEGAGTPAAEARVAADDRATFEFSDVDSGLEGYAGFDWVAISSTRCERVSNAETNWLWLSAMCFRALLISSKSPAIVNRIKSFRYRGLVHDI